MEQKNLIIAFGGVSPEHEVSVLTAIQASYALEKSEWNRIPLYISKKGAWLTGDHLLELESYQDMKKAEQKAVPAFFMANGQGIPQLVTKPEGWLAREQRIRIDMLLCAFHGAEGENGAFQGLCESYNIPYTGSGVAASALGMDKRLAKDYCEKYKIPVVEDTSIREEEWIKNKDSLLLKAEKPGYPLYVKPATLGSSIGVCRTDNRTRLIDAIEASFRYDSHLLVEKAITPLTEINCSVYGDEESQTASVCEQPLGKQEGLSFEDKYMQGEGEVKGMASANRIIPAPLPPDKTKEIQNLSKKIFRLLGCSGVARLDFLMQSDNGKLYFNEINTIPGSFSFYLWEASGLTFQELLFELIKLANKQHQKKNSRTRSHEINFLSQKAVKGLKGLKSSK